MKPGYFLIPAFLLLMAAASCNKGNTSKHAKLSLASITTTVQPGDSMVVKLNFDNSGGSLGNGIFVSIRTRINQEPLPPIDSVGADTLSNGIPDFNGASKGQFQMVLDYDDYLSESASLHLNDTLVFKFYAITPGNDTSNVVTSPQVVVINP